MHHPPREDNTRGAAEVAGVGVPRQVTMHGTPLALNGVRVSINGGGRGAAPGDDLQPAVLRIWLGDEPADDDLERGMPGGDLDSRRMMTAFLLTLRDTLPNTRQNQRDSSSSWGEFTTAGDAGAPWGNS